MSRLAGSPGNGYRFAPYTVVISPGRIVGSNIRQRKRRSFEADSVPTNAALQIRGNSNRSERDVPNLCLRLGCPFLPDHNSSRLLIASFLAMGKGCTKK
jgi:hypothetical protein